MREERRNQKRTRFPSNSEDQALDTEKEMFHPCLVPELLSHLSPFKKEKEQYGEMNLEFDTQNKIENEGRKDKGNDITNNKNRLFHNYFTKFKENGLNNYNNSFDKRKYQYEVEQKNYSKSNLTYTSNPNTKIFLSKPQKNFLPNQASFSKHEDVQSHPCSDFLSQTIWTPNGSFKKIQSNLSSNSSIPPSISDPPSEEVCNPDCCSIIIFP